MRDRIWYNTGITNRIVPMTLTDTAHYLDTTAELLLSFPDRRDMLEALVDLGSELPPYPDQYQTDANYVPGCASKVWVYTERLPDGTVHMYGKSEALIVRGFVAILIQSLQGLTPELLLHSRPQIESFVVKTKISESVLATRANSFGLIYEKIMSQAQQL